MKTLKLEDYKDLKGKTLKGIFGDCESLQVPPYQRDFAWEDNEVNAFLESFKEILTSHENHFFFGQIVTARDSEDKHKVDVIDGQQRLTWFTILIHCIWVKVSKLTYSDTANYFSPDTLTNAPPSLTHEQQQIGNFTQARSLCGNVSEWFLKENSQGKKLHERLKLQNDKHSKIWPIIFDESCDLSLIKEKFEKYQEEVSQLKSKNINDGISYGDEYLFKAFEIIYTYINDIDDKTLIDHFWYNIQDFNDKKRIHAAHLDATSLDVGITLFTKMNATGKQLTAPDLIKAHLCDICDKEGLGKHRLDKWIKEFEKVEKDLQEYFKTSEQVFTEFILHWAWSKYDEDDDPILGRKRISEDTIYELAQNSLKNDESIESFLKELKNQSQVFIKLKNFEAARKKPGLFKAGINNESKLDSIQNISVRMREFLGTDSAHYRILLFAYSQLSDNPHGAQLTWNEEDSYAIDSIVDINKALYSFLVRSKIVSINSQTQRRTIIEAVRAGRKKLQAHKIQNPAAKHANVVAKSIIDKLMSNMPTDDEVVEALKSSRHSRNKFPTALLWEIEYQLRLSSSSGPDLDFLAAETRKKFDCDHICPEQSTTHWEGAYAQGQNKDRYKLLSAHISKLGNRMPLSKKINRAAKNKVLGEKIAKYFENDLKIHKLFIKAITKSLKERIENNEKLDLNQRKQFNISLEDIASEAKIKRKLRDGSMPFNTLWDNECIDNLSSQYAELLIKIFPKTI